MLIARFCFILLYVGLLLYSFSILLPILCLLWVIAVKYGRRILFQNLTQRHNKMKAMHGEQCWHESHQMDWSRDTIIQPDGLITWYKRDLVKHRWKITILHKQFFIYCLYNVFAYCMNTYEYVCKDYTMQRLLVLDYSYSNDIFSCVTTVAYKLLLYMY